MMRVVVLNGPNLNLLGTREPSLYGTTTLNELEEKVGGWAQELGMEVDFTQSNHEGALVDAIHAARGWDGIVINPGALTHTSRSIGDAILAAGVPTVEVHISNIKQRESWRAVSMVSEACARTIFGRGITGYRDALRHLSNRSAGPFETLRYGPANDHVADLRLPEGATQGFVVLVHGGFWLQEWERDTMETLAVDLAGRGFASLNVEYRRLGVGGGWPASAHDVRMALDYAPQVQGLDGLPMAAVGHSAGGHLALWAAARDGHEPVRATVGLAAVTDLAALAAVEGPGRESARRLLDGGAPPALDALPDRVYLVHGSQDSLVPPGHSTRLESRTDVSVVTGLGHFEMLDPSREHWPTVVDFIGAGLV